VSPLVDPPSSSPRPVVLLHGFSGSGRAWGELIPTVLRERSELLVVDLPGHESRAGAIPLSRSPSDPSRFRFEAVLESLASLLDRRGISVADWVGYSMGGRLALGMAVSYPTRVGRLVLESASPGIQTPPERVERQRQDRDLAAWIETQGVAAFVDRWLAQPLFASQARLPAAKREAARALRLEHSATGLAEALRGMGVGVQPSYWRQLGDLQADTLLLTGSLDAKFVALAKEMAKDIPRVRAITVEGVGHNLHLEAPEAWLERVVPFLEQGAGGGSP